MTFTSYGYQVIKAENGLEGLSNASKHKGTIDLLITDVVMPSVGGIELAQKLTLERPGVKTLFMSGYSETRLVEDGMSRVPASSFIQKPFVLREIVQRARQMMDVQLEPVD